MKLFLLLLIIISTVCARHRVRRLISGQNASPGQFPYQVSLQNIPNNRHFCGGSILNERYVLTAAHCIENKNLINITILVGSHIKNSGGDYHRVINMTSHPDYDTQHNTNDIAILKVEKNIIFNNLSQPIPLNTAQIPCNANLTVSGWGRIGTAKVNIDGEDFEISLITNTLQFLEVIQLTFPLCNLILSTISGANNIKNNIKLTDDMFCALSGYGHGICNGDSGSPAVYNGILVGIASWSTKNCGQGIPEGYTNVTSFLTWINETMEQMDILESEPEADEEMLNILPEEFNNSSTITNDLNEDMTTEELNEDTTTTNENLIEKFA